MAKRIIWTERAQKSWKATLTFWIKHNGSREYSQKLQAMLKTRLKFLRTEVYTGKPTSFGDVRVTLISHFSIFYKIEPNEIILIEIWDNRRNPEDLRQSFIA